MSSKIVFATRRISRRLWFRVAVVLLVGAVFFVLAVRQTAELARERDTYAYLLRTNNWIASQVEVELLRFLRTLDRYALADPDVTHADLRLRFDILWSRLPVFLTGPEAKEARKLAGATELVSGLLHDLERLEPLVQALVPGDSKHYQVIRMTLGDREAAVHDMVHKLLAGGHHQALVDRINQSQAGGFLLLMGLMLAGIVIIIFLLYELWRGHRLAVRESAARWNAEAANHAKSQFLAHMSHELRTPLNAIIGFSEILKEEIFGPLGATHYKSYAGDIHRSGLHLLQILSDILDMAKVEAGGLVLDERQFSPAEAVHEAVRMVSITAMRKNVKLTCHSPAQQFDDLLMSGDERLFRQIVVNLLANAVKFTEADGTVTATLTVEEGELAVRVADSGIGIAPDDLKRVTDPFYRVAGAFNAQHEGTGLGLALVKAFVELHGGKLEIASTPGQGTEVTVRFPQSRLHRAAPPDLELTDTAA